MTSLFLRNSQKDHLFLEQQSAKRISKKDIYWIHAKKNLENNFGQAFAYLSEKPSRADTLSVKRRYTNHIPENK